MSEQIVRSQKEINEVINQADQNLSEIGTKYPGMNYEEGIKAFYDWLIGSVEEPPFE